MYLYKPVHTHDQLRTFNIPRKRLCTAFGVFLLFSIGLLIRTNQQRLQGAFANEGLHGSSGGVPGVQYDIVDEWQPPSDWDPVKPVWEDFPRYDSHQLTCLHEQGTEIHQK